MYASEVCPSVETQNIASLRPSYLLQRPSLRVNDKPSDHDVSRQNRQLLVGILVGKILLVALLRHESLVVFDNLVNHNQSFFKISAKIAKLLNEKIILKPISCKYKNCIFAALI